MDEVVVGEGFTLGSAGKGHLGGLFLNSVDIGSYANTKGIGFDLKADLNNTARARVNIGVGSDGEPQLGVVGIKADIAKGEADAKITCKPEQGCKASVHVGIRF